LDDSSITSLAALWGAQTQTQTQTQGKKAPVETQGKAEGGGGRVSSKGQNAAPDHGDKDVTKERKDEAELSEILRSFCFSDDERAQLQESIGFGVSFN
jgi:hypothetical protein